MNPARVTVAAGTIVLLSILLASVGQVWALSVSPSTPIANQRFTVNSGAVIAESINVYSGPGCVGALIASGWVPAGGMLPVPGQPAGQYSTDTNFEVGCLNFTVIPPPFQQ